MCVTRRQLRVIGSVDFFHEHGAIRKLAWFAVIRCCAGRGVGHVHMVSFGINHCIRPKQFKSVSVIGGLANVSILVDELKPVKALRALGIGSLISGQNNYRENENNKPDSNRHLLVLPLLYRGALGSVWMDTGTLLRGLGRKDVRRVGYAF